ncbi:MAG TPA: lactate racemase domain-containing protein [Kofleriaceae bacterium]|nr:lactate racemase domain-containing protein [Kofleriaceae bacterium]
MRVELPYGRFPLAFDAGAHPVTVVKAAELPEPPPVRQLLISALASAARPTGSLAEASERVTIIVSDPTRKEPRQELLTALSEYIDTKTRVTLAVATGTHGPCRIEDLGISQRSLQNAHAIVNHDGHSDVDLVDLGTTTRGTPIRVHRCLVEADVVIATGCIRPHYFAGFGAGAKAFFPGLGQAAAIRMNHRLKTEPLSRAGIVDGNPCREDIEEAVAKIPTRKFILNGVAGPDDRIHAVVAGGRDDSARFTDRHETIDEVFRRGVSISRPWFTARARRAPLVIASDDLPVTASLYQAAKIAAAVAPLVEENGTLALVADCHEGVGPLETVNEAIFRIGILPRLPQGVRLVLISSLAPDVVAQTLCNYAPSIDALIAELALPSSAPITVVPRASQLLCEAHS